MSVFDPNTLVYTPCKYFRPPECRDDSKSPLETYWRPGFASSLWSGLRQLWWDIKLFLEKP